jgi:hypothetical protein
MSSYPTVTPPAGNAATGGSGRVSAAAGKAKAGLMAGGKAAHGCLTESCAGFRDFILRGNVVDLAVAIVVGAAFTELIKYVWEGRGGKGEGENVGGGIRLEAHSTDAIGASS